MIITTCGYGNTGASAVLDFLKGYKNLDVLDNVEFQLIHMPDGINDLKYHLVYSKERIGTNVAIQRFKNAAFNSFFGKKIIKQLGKQYIFFTNAYIDSISNVKWKGASKYDTSDVSVYSANAVINKTQIYCNSLIKKIGFSFHFPSYKERFFSLLSEDEFDIKTREYLKNIMKLISNNNNIVLDMLVSGTNPLQGSEFFDNLKTIVVYRNPLDLYIRATEHYNTNGYLPCRNVKDFSIYYRLLMKHSQIDASALYIQYEDLIYKYYDTTKKIMDYLGFNNRPENEFKFFNPDISVKYTQAWKTYPGHNDEIEFIKKELSEYLYSYEEYIPVAEQAKEINIV